MSGGAGTCEGVEDDAAGGAPDLDDLLEKPQRLHGIEAMTSTDEGAQFVNPRLALPRLGMLP